MLRRRIFHGANCQGRCIINRARCLLNPESLTLADLLDEKLRMRNNWQFSAINGRTTALVNVAASGSLIARCSKG